MYDLNGSWENFDLFGRHGYLAFTEEDNLKILRRITLSVS